MQLDYPWLKGLPALNQSFLPADLAASSANSGVQKWVFVESGCDPGQSLAEVNWVASFARHETRLKGIVAQAALEKGGDIQAELEVLADQPLVKGVRRLLQGESDPDFCLQPGFVEGAGLLADLGFTFDICIRQEQLPAVTELARRVSTVQFILDHCGKPAIRDRQTEPWANNLKALAMLPNVSMQDFRPHD